MSLGPEHLAGLCCPDCGADKAWIYGQVWTWVDQDILHWGCLRCALVWHRYAEEHPLWPRAEAAIRSTLDDTSLSIHENPPDARVPTPPIPRWKWKKETTMATRTVIEYIDDIDGSDAAESITFGLDKDTYEIDLSEDNAAELRSQMNYWIKYARKTSGRKPRK